MRLLITRPEEDGSRLAAHVRALGWEPVLLPLLKIEYTDAPALPLDGAQALIATSRNGLRALARNASFEAAKRLPIYCVGEGTAALAEEFGFNERHVGEGTGRELVPLIARTAKPDTGALLYLTGEHIAFDLASVLAALRFTVRRFILYHAVENPDTGQLLGAYLRRGLHGAVLMSPRTAEIFANLLTTDLLTTNGQAAIRDLTCYCYSTAVAKPLEAFKGLRLKIAARPVESDLLSLIGSTTV
jgi:uroporphyrinogen-III synthase